MLTRPRPYRAARFLMLGVCVAVCLGVSTIPAWIDSNSSLMAWGSESGGVLPHDSWQTVLQMAGIALHALFGVAVWHLWVRNCLRFRLSLLVCAELALNAAWNVSTGLLFAVQRPLPAFVSTLGLLAIVCALTYSCVRHSRLAMWILLSYFVWVMIAAVVSGWVLLAGSGRPLITFPF